MFTFYFEYESQFGGSLISGKVILTVGDERYPEEFAIEDIVLDGESKWNKCTSGPEATFHRAQCEYAMFRVMKDKAVEQEWLDFLQSEGLGSPDPNDEHRTHNHAMTGVYA